MHAPHGARDVGLPGVHPQPHEGRPGYMEEQCLFVHEANVRREAEFIRKELEKLEKKIDDTEKETRGYEAEKSKVLVHVRELNEKLARLNDAEEEKKLARDLATQQKRRKYDVPQLVKLLYTNKRSGLTGEASLKWDPPTTLAEALKQCDDSKQVASLGVAYKFSQLAKFGKKYFIEVARRLAQSGATVTFERLLDCAKRTDGEGVGTNNDYKMTAFALYVDWLVDKFAFASWDCISFTNWNDFDNYACGLKQNQHARPNNYRMLVGLQFLPKAGFAVGGLTAASDNADRPEFKTNLQSAMETVASRGDVL